MSGAGSSRRGAGRSHGGGGAAPAGSWPSSLGIPEAMELRRYNILVPPSSRLPGTWHISAAGYAVEGLAAPRSEVRTFPGDRWNALGRRRFWEGRHWDDILRECRAGRLVLPPPPAAGARRPPPPPAAAAPPPPAGLALLPPAVPEVEIPPEQRALRQEGDPDDKPGFLAAFLRSTTEPGLVPPPEMRDPADPDDTPGLMETLRNSAAAAEDDDDLGWLDDLSSSDGGADGGMGGEVIDLAGTDEDA